jgi:hypothetical protein
MTAHRMFPAPKTPKMLLWCLFLFPARLSSQAPQTPGRLTVTSTPQQGAKIVIDGQDTGRLTNFNFVVSPGDHDVSLPSVFNCKQPKKVTISSGSTTSVNCDAAAGWGDPTSK